MMSKSRKWIACLAAVLLVFQAAPAFMEDGEYISNISVGTLAGFRDVMEITSDGGAFMLEGESMTIMANEDYAPVWTSSNPEVVAIDGSGASHSVTVRAVGFGEAEITAEEGNQRKSYAITVINPEGYETEEPAATGTTETPEGTEPEAGTEAAEPQEKQKAVIVVNGGTLLTHYNGEEQRFGEYTATSTSAAFDASKVKLTREIEVTGKDCGYYVMNLTAQDFTYDDSAVNAIFVVNDGYMKINPAKATVQADNLTKAAGEADPELTATVTGTFGEDQLTYELTRDEGEEEGFYRIAVTGESLQGNYRIQFMNGVLTITEPAEETEEEKTPMSIHVVSDWPEGQLAFIGTKITLTAELTGFEGKEYTLQWQYSTDLQEWHDEAGANGLSFTYELNEETENYTWRVVARDIH